MKPMPKNLGAGCVRRMEPEHRRTLCKVRRRSRARGESGRYVILTAEQARHMLWALRRAERRHEKAPGRRNRAVGYVGIEVYALLCKRAVTSRGKLDNLSYEGMAAVLGFAKSAIVAAVKRLRAFGWLDWFRQYLETGNAGRRGVQVEQTFNFYWLTAPLKALAKLGIHVGPPPIPDDHDHRAKDKDAERRAGELADSPLTAALDRLGAAVAAKAVERDSSTGSDS